MLNLDHLKEGIGLRGWGQKTPLIEYKREAFEMFKEMITQIHFDIVHHIFHLNTTHFDSRHFEERREQEMDEINLSSNSQ
jgi:preprotein translocase subunit SecA